MPDIFSEQTQFQQNYEINPIVLVNGIAGSGSTMNITVLTEGYDQVFGNPDDYFAHFKPVSGGTLQEWQIAEYPFATVQMAANAVIQMPLKVSLIMACPAKNSTNTNRNTYPAKSAIITNLKTQLNQHVLLGGTFTILTPAYTYENCLLVALRDISSVADKQVQFLYQWDFVQPLITTEAAAAIYSNTLNNINNGVFVNTPLSWNNP
jgi:hypothetical protein